MNPDVRPALLNEVLLTYQGSLSVRPLNNVTAEADAGTEALVVIPRVEEIYCLY